MSARNILMAAAGSADDKLYVDDVFSTYLYTGNGSAKTINNGIDLAAKGGLVWCKVRNTTSSNFLFDTARGANALFSNLTNGQQSEPQGITSFNANGFTLGTNGGTNGADNTFASWTFRKAPKFFAVVPYTGDGVAGRQIPHSLGVVPGMMIVKNTSAANSWQVWHRSRSGETGVLNSTGAFSANQEYFFGNNTISVNPTDTDFTVANDGGVNADGKIYVAYLFAHDDSADGIVQCGSFTTDGSGNATVNHGWAKGVQFALLKASSTTGDWEMFDTARTAGWSGSDARLRANLSDVEDSVSRLSASGTSVSFTGLTAEATYIYMFIVNP